MDGDRKLWVAHPTDGFKLGRIVDIGADTLTIEPFDSPGTGITVPYDRVFPSDDRDLSRDVDDNCALVYLNEATLLHNVSVRYGRNVIYTYVANILIAVNPYKDLSSLYSSQTIASYKGKSIGQAPPHVFAIADKAYREMKLAKITAASAGVNVNQSVIVSGESGAGKTETTKHILKYLTECYGQHAGPVEQRVVESNPLLEAFGNAKTTRNNNSSRFGKFVEVHFDSKLGVAGGQVSHYLLEKSRVVSQQAGERNYHIFYRLCAGAPEQLHKTLQLASPDQFQMLRRGCTQYFCSAKTQQLVTANRKSLQYTKEGCLTDVQLDDVADFKRTDEAMEKMGIETQDRGHIYSIVAGILHLGNVQFEEQKDGKEGGCRVHPDTEAAVRTASSLLQIVQTDLEFALTTRVTQAAKGGAMGTVIRKALSVGEAASARDALAKHIYSRLFDYIVERVNRALPLRDSASYIGILDIAGFEYFQSNSFEQLCINYCNEKLQNFFNERILREEQALYEREGVPVERISFVDNIDCIELFENKGIGIFDLLDEENRLPRPAYDHYTNEVHAKNKAHFRLAVPRKSKLKTHREMRDDQGFLIKHFAGAVCYSTLQFVEKNNDALHASLEVIVHDSKHPLLQKIFAEDSNKKTSGTGKLNFISVGGKFRSQLDVLMNKLKSTGTHFIRCVKPNAKMVSSLFEGANVLSQLQCSGMPSVLELMHKGYPSRTRFDELYNRYSKMLPARLAKLEPRVFCKMLFKALGMQDTDFVFGQTKVFFKSGKFSEFDQLVRTDPEGLGAMISQLTRWLIRYRWRFAQYGVWEVIKLRNKITYRRAAIVKVQKTVRMFIAVRKYRHRFVTQRAIRKLSSELDKMHQIVKQLKHNDKEMKAVETIHAQLNDSINKLRNLSERVTREQAAAMYSAATDRVQATFTTLKKKLEEQKIREEEERIKKIQEELERERARKLEEERKQREEEEDRRRRAELEETRKREEDQRRRAEEEDRRLAESLQKQLQQEREAEAERAKLIEQERVDRELALRLSHEDTNLVEDIVTVSAPRASVQSAKPSSKGGKYDLSAWTYAQLRDSINTSVDLDMITACREEFHRRLKVYHDWKTKQKQKKQIIAPLLGQTAPPAASKPPPKTAAPAPPTSGVHEQVDLEEAMQTPPSLLENAAAREKHEHLQSLKSGGKSSSSPTKRAGLAGTNPQRYFRVPLLDHEEASSALGKNGWWLAHFDGRYIARQCAVLGSLDDVDNSRVRLMVAGTDDLCMCELALEETGLTQRKGAEISEADFESVWDRLGGKKYLQDRRTQVASKYLRTKLGLN